MKEKKGSYSLKESNSNDYQLEGRDDLEKLLKNALYQQMI